MLSPFTSFVQAPVLAKLLIFFLVWLVVWLPLAIPLAIVLKWNPLQPSTTAQKIPLVVSLYLVVPIVIWGASVLEGVSWAEYGLVWRVSMLRSFTFGAIAGTVGLLALFFIQQRLGWAKLERLRTVPLSAKTENPTEAEHGIQTISLTLLPIVALGLWVSAIEELVFRGFLWHQLQRDYAVWVAAAMVGLLFAFLHLVWEGRKILPQLPGLWLMGMVLSLACWVDQGQLGLAIGLHTGWIWTLASLDALVLIHYPNPNLRWLTGFNDHPLAGGMGIGFLLLTGATLGLLGATYCY